MRIVNLNNPSYHYLLKPAAIQERSKKHSQIRNSNRGLVNAGTEAAPHRGDRACQSESINYRNSKEDRMTSKVWFITGSSRGFGRIWAEAALKRGDKVAATARELTG